MCVKSTLFIQGAKHNHEYSNRIRIIIKEEIDMKGKNILYTTSIIFGLSLAFATNPITTCANWHDNPLFNGSSSIAVSDFTQ